MKYRAIRENADKYSIQQMCRVMKVSRSGYYDWLKRGENRRQKDDRALAVKIRSIFVKHKGRYGSPRIHDELRDQSIRCGKARVERIMRLHGLRARPKRRFVVTTDSNHAYPVAPNLLDRKFHAHRPNQVWVSDITYIRTFEGWLYLATIMDLFSRKIVGWAMDDTITADLALAALNMAVHRRRPPRGLLHHSDRGVQYACHAYQKVLRKHGMVCSMSRVGNCWDNAPMESFFSTLKIECVYPRTFLSRTQAMSEIFEYIEVDYNRKRRHSSLGSMSPEDFETLSNCA